MVDSCRQLTGSQSGGDEDTAGMVTILTAHAVEELADRSAPMKVCGKAKARCQKNSRVEGTSTGARAAPFDLYSLNRVVCAAV